MSDSVTDQSELISHFSNVTGIEADRAKFYLESAAWDLQVALASFYEDDNDIVEQIASVAPNEDYTAQTSTGPLASKPQAKSQTNIATVASLKHDNSSDEEEGQAFYAGGSERSGQQVLGPGKKNDLITEMFKSAKAHGAEVIRPSDEPSTSRKGNAVAFKGTGYRLGATDDDTTVVSANAGPRSETAEPAEIILKMWQNGFSVDNGPLRDYHDPGNQGFLESIRRGEIPTEFLRGSKGSEITLNMEDHRHEEFVVPKTTTKVFSGAGHMLGSPVPNVVVDITPKVTPNDSGDRMVNIDESQPITNVQVRLADGTKLVARLNEEHTVRDLYSFVSRSSPQYTTIPFVLMTTFPNQELNNQALTLKEASLLNAVIVQRLK